MKIIECPNCGQPHELLAKGMCRSCYMRLWRSQMSVCPKCGRTTKRYSKATCTACYARARRAKKRLDAATDVNKPYDHAGAA